MAVTAPLEASPASHVPCGACECRGGATNMSVPQDLFVSAGYANDEAAKLKKMFDEQEVLLVHLATGEITQVRAGPRHRDSLRTVNRPIRTCRICSATSSASSSWASA